MNFDKTYYQRINTSAKNLLCPLIPNTLFLSSIRCRNDTLERKHQLINRTHYFHAEIYKLAEINGPRMQNRLVVGVALFMLAAFFSPVNLKVISRARVPVVTSTKRGDDPSRLTYWAYRGPPKAICFWVRNEMSGRKFSSAWEFTRRISVAFDPLYCRVRMEICMRTGGISEFPNDVMSYYRKSHKQT